MRHCTLAPSVPPWAPPVLLGALALACRPPWVAAFPGTLDIPEELREAVGRVVVNTTPCSVTCGLGSREETACEVGPDGVRRQCQSQRLQCLSSWACGMLHFTALAGRQFALSCVSLADLLEEAHEAYRFTWRLARGVISTDDETFRPLRISSSSVRFPALREYDAGTYRCDVQLLRNLRLVKRLYFGLRVLPRGLVALNFQQSLTENQKLVDMGLDVDLDNVSTPSQPPWEQKVAAALGLGVPLGVAMGVLLALALCRWLQENPGPGQPEPEGPNAQEAKRAP